MVDAIDRFRPYLQVILAGSRENTYRDWQEFYLPTQVELPLRVQTCLPSQVSSQVREEKREQMEVLDGLRKYASGHVLVVGKPGSGKSTSLKRLWWEEARRCLQGEKQENNGVPQIPVFLELRGFQCDSVLQLIQRSLRQWKLRLSEAEIEDLLFDGKLLLLLDGLNELPSDAAWQKVDDFRRGYADTPMIFSTRELGAGADLGIEEKLEMMPLTELQMRQFIEKRLPRQAEDLLRQIRDRLRELAETPLLLKLLCDVFAQKGQIPRNRGELFRQEFARRYEEFKPLRGRISEDSRRFAPELLQYLAFVMIQGDPHSDPCKPTASWLTVSKTKAEQILSVFLAGGREPDRETKAKAKEWIEDLLEYHLLQIANDSDKIEFHHQLFQEYYAAEWLLLQLPTLSDEQLKYYFLNYLKWTEIISLTLGLVGKGDHAIQVVKLALAIDLVLGAKLAGAVNNCLQPQAIDEITKYQLPRACEVYLLGSTQSKEAIEALVKALEEENYWVRNNAIQSLGEIKDSSAVTGIVRAIQDTNLTNRIIAIRALARFNDKQAIDGLKQALNHEDSTTSTEAERALENLIQQQETQQEILASHIEDSTDYLQLSFDGLEKLDLEIDDKFCHFFVKHIENIFSDKQLSKNFNNWIYVSKFMNWLGRKNDSKAIELLTKLSSPKYSYWIYRPTKASSKIIPILRIKRQHYWIRRSAVEALGETDNEKVISVLMSSLEDRDWGVCESAEIALEKLSISEAIIPIKNLLLKEDRPYLLSTVAKIQERCKFYNHDIAKSPPPSAVRQDVRVGNQEQTINIESVGILNTSDVTIHGNQIGDTSNG